jgi:hypothetical protein
MLAISGVGNPREVVAKIDPYIPIDMSFGRYLDTEKLYWRAVAKPASLVEIGVCARDGSIASLTVTNLAPEQIKEGTVSMDDLEEEGTPLFDTSIWPSSCPDRHDQRFLDCNSVATLVLGAGEVMLWLSDERLVSRWIGDRRVAFAVGADDSLLGICLHGLPEQDLDLLRAHGKSVVAGAEKSTR